jgi:hypothetical protein
LFVGIESLRFLWLDLSRAGKVTRARVGQRGALRIGRGVRVAGLAAPADLDRVTSASEEQGGRIGEALLLRAGDLGDPAVLGLRLLARVGEGFGDDPGGHELRSHLGQVADAILDRPPDQLIDELVELGRANDPDRERAFEQRLSRSRPTGLESSLDRVGGCISSRSAPSGEEQLRGGMGLGRLQ